MSDETQQNTDDINTFNSWALGALSGVGLTAAGAGLAMTFGLAASGVIAGAVLGAGMAIAAGTLAKQFTQSDTFGDKFASGLRIGGVFGLVWTGAFTHDSFAP